MLWDFTEVDDDATATVGLSAPSSRKRGTNSSKNPFENHKSSRFYVAFRSPYFIVQWAHIPRVGAYGTDNSRWRAWSIPSCSCSRRGLTWESTSTASTIFGVRIIFSKPPWKQPRKFQVLQTEIYCHYKGTPVIWFSCSFSCSLFTAPPLRSRSGAKRIWTSKFVFDGRSPLTRSRVGSKSGGM